MNIPKIIHYFWFGGNPKPEIVIKCIESWKKYMPDWEIKEWNEFNYDVNKVPYVKQAYEAKKWAFVSDYARFDILNEMGGLYFDTDVELLKTIPDTYFQTAFTGVDGQGMVSPGLIMACPPQHWILQEMLDSYNKSVFNVDKLNADITVNTRITNILVNYGFQIKDETQKVRDLRIYCSDIFCGYDIAIHETKVTDATLSIHHFASSWMTEKQLRKRKLQTILKKIIGVDNYKRILKIKRKLFGIAKV